MRTKKLGKEAYSYIISHCSPPKGLEDGIHWGTMYRKKCKRDFKESYLNYVKTGKIIVLNEELTQK